MDCCTRGCLCVVDAVLVEALHQRQPLMNISTSSANEQNWFTIGAAVKCNSFDQPLFVWSFIPN